MFKPINGYTKESIIEVLKKEFKGKALDHYGNCQNLTSDNKKCAIGCFIPDGHEAQRWDNIGVDDLLKIYPDLLLPFKLRHLRRFQDFHDNASLDLSLEQMIEWVEQNVE